MTQKPLVHSTFQVTSGCICYGELHNIWHGASVDKQPFPPAITMRDEGTVDSQILHYNTVAENGKWTVYQLKDRHTAQVCGWFACHSRVEPEPEIDRILRISGSPYESDSGSSFNDETTFAEAVLVVNRYDWGWYDNRCKDQAAESGELDIQELHVGIGLVDREGAKDAVEAWTHTASQDRENMPGGVWMHIPHMEYQFGRFGFDSDRKAARSFLFFTTYTVFGRTTFDGLRQTLREPEEDDGGEDQPQIGSRWPHDPGEGIMKLKERIAIADDPSTLPADQECLGPYGIVEGVLKDSDIDAIRVLSKRAMREFQNKWSEQAYRCINEMVMSYLERYIVPITSHDTTLAAATSLFPEHERPESLDKCMYDFMQKPDLVFAKVSAESFDRKRMGNRIQGFLITRSPSKNLTQDENFIEGLMACAIFLVSEVLELSDLTAQYASRKKIFPLDIRTAVFDDQDFLRLFKYSRYFWEGDKP